MTADLALIVGLVVVAAVVACGCAFAVAAIDAWHDRATRQTEPVPPRATLTLGAPADGIGWATVLDGYMVYWTTVEDSGPRPVREYEEAA